MIPAGTELARPRSGLAELCGFGGDVVGEAGVAEFNDLAADLDDATEAALPHARKDSLQQEEGRLDEELQLVEVGLPGLLLDRKEGLVTGRVHDENFNRPQSVLYLADELADGRGIADIGTEGMGGQTSLLEIVAESCRTITVGEEVDGDGMAGFGKACGHGGAETARGSCDKGSSRHVASLPGMRLRRIADGSGDSDRAGRRARERVGRPDFLRSVFRR